MSADASQRAIENYINTLLQNSEEVFLVEVKVSPGNNILVFLDADNGITIDKCVQVNRALYKYIEENSLFENGNFSLEVSSPGIDEPLKLKRQYIKNIGRTVEVLLADESIKEGKLVSVNDEEIVIEQKQGKIKKYHPDDKAGQATNKNTTILFNQIKHTTVLVTF